VELLIVGTREIVVDLLKAQAITLETADQLLAEWRDKHRFALAIKSFGELIAK
jgi:hypothetical protein